MNNINKNIEIIDLLDELIVSKLNNLEISHNFINNSFNTNKDYLDYFNKILLNIKENIDQFKKNMDQLKENMDQLKENMDQLKENMDQLKENTEYNEKYKKYKKYRKYYEKYKEYNNNKYIEYNNKYIEYNNKYIEYNNKYINNINNAKKNYTKPLNIDDLKKIKTYSRRQKLLLQDNAAFYQTIIATITTKNKVDFPITGPMRDKDKKFQDLKIKLLLQAIIEKKTSSTGIKVDYPLGSLGVIQSSVLGVRTSISKVFGAINSTAKITGYGPLIRK